MENRRFIKHLISGQESTGFKNDLNKAISRILGENKSLEDKNRGKRNVIKHQTQETKYSLAESISRTKVEDRFLYQTHFGQVGRTGREGWRWGEVTGTRNARVLWFL